MKERAITDELRVKMLGWRYCGGFSAHNQVRVGAYDAEGRTKLAGFMIRAPMSLEKMTYDAASGTVIYRSKMHLGLNAVGSLGRPRSASALCHRVRRRLSGSPLPFGGGRRGE